MSLKYTRSIIDAILEGSLKNTPSVKNELFGFEVPTECLNVPDEIMQLHDFIRNIQTFSWNFKSE